MVQEFFKSDIGLIVKDNTSIRVKSSYKKTIISNDEFIKSNPIKINKQVYLTELNTFFKKDKFSWEYNGDLYQKLDNFDFQKYKVDNYNLDDIPKHNNIFLDYDCFIVMYHGRLYYTFVSGNYFPQMQLIDFHTKKITNKWTNIKNLSPIFNKTTKQII